MTSLADLVRAERERAGLSLRELAARSDGRVSSSTIHAIEKGKTTAVTHQTLQALADNLPVSLRQLELAAQLKPSDNLGRFELPRRADRLGRKERAAVLAMVDALLEAKRR